MTTSKGSHRCNWKNGCIFPLKTMTYKSQDLIQMSWQENNDRGKEVDIIQDLLLFLGEVLQRVMLRPYKNAQLCATSRHMASCD